MTAAMTAGLHTDQAPPLSIPSAFFLLAPLAMIVGGVLMTEMGAALVETAWSPLTIALAHLGTLGLLGSVMIGASTDSTPTHRYLDYFCRSWGYITEFIIDTHHYGWRMEGLDTAGSTLRPKATMWKDASHEFAALLECLAMLERLPPARSNSAGS